GARRMHAALAARAPELGRLFRFGCVGVAATLVYYTGTVALAEGWHWPAVLSSLLCMCASTLVSYFGHKRVTFGVAGAPGPYAPLYLLIVASPLGLTAALPWSLAELPRLPPSWTAAAVTVAIPVSNYLPARFVVFAEGRKPRREPMNDTTGAEPAPR